jgi:hypothetical protein
MVISLYFRNTLLIRFKIVRSIFSNENTMVVLTLWITGSITEVLLLTTLLQSLRPIDFSTYHLSTYGHRQARRPESVRAEMVKQLAKGHGGNRIPQTVETIT